MLQCCWVTSTIRVLTRCMTAKWWWRHQMETFSTWLALCAGNSPVPVKSPYKGQWRRALMFSLICVWINGLVYNREAGDLGHHRGHYDVSVMYYQKWMTHISWFMISLSVIPSSMYRTSVLYSFKFIVLPMISQNFTDFTDQMNTC